MALQYQESMRKRICLDQQKQTRYSTVLSLLLNSILRKVLKRPFKHLKPFTYKVISIFITIIQLLGKLDEPAKIQNTYRSISLAFELSATQPFKVEMQIQSSDYFLYYYPINSVNLQKYQNMKESESKADSNITLTQTNPQSGDLVLNQKFSYQFFQKNRYSISELGNYEALCNNGFIKLYTKQCRVYWHTQNQFSHQVQDWKFHISVTHKHLKAAWNLIAALFFKLKCRAGIKVIYLNEANGPQKGRQITLYLIKYDPKFKHSAFASDFGLDIDIQHSEDYWLEMCRQIQGLLESFEIQSNGLAPGDLPLGKYISFRNEAFIHNQKGESIYPPNSAGWNPLHQKLPINLDIFKELSGKQTVQNKFTPLHVLIVVGVLVSAYWMKLHFKVK